MNWISSSHPQTFAYSDLFTKFEIKGFLGVKRLNYLIFCSG